MIPTTVWSRLPIPKPVLQVTVSEACEIVRQYETGVIAQPGNTTDVAEKIHTLGQNPDLRYQLGNNGRIASKEHYNRKQIALQFEAYLNKEKR